MILQNIREIRNPYSFQNVSMASKIQWLGSTRKLTVESRMRLHGKLRTEKIPVPSVRAFRRNDLPEWYLKDKLEIPLDSRSR